MKLKLVVVDLELSRRQKAVGAVAIGLSLALATTLAGAAPVPFVADETLTATKLNGNFNGLDERLAILEAAGSHVSVLLSSSFTVGDFQFVRVPYDNVQFDALDEYDAASHQFVASAAGTYLVCASLFGVANSPPGNTELDLYVNEVRGHAFAWNSPAQSPLTGCASVRLQAGDVLDVRVLQDSTGPANYTLFAPFNWLEITKLSR